MHLTQVTAPGKTYRLRGLAMFRFAFNWLAVILVILGALNCIVFGVPPGVVSSGRTYFFARLTVLLLIGLWYTWPMVWKIETSDDGLAFRTLFQRRFVSWSKLTDVEYQRWGYETVYVVRCHDQRSIRFPSGINEQDELLASIKQFVPDKLLTIGKESRQGKLSMFRQAFFLLWSCGATAGGAILSVLALAKLLSGDPLSAIGIVIGMLFLGLGIILGTTTMLRAKTVRITEYGLLVRTWLPKFEVAWQDITSVRRFPFGKTMIIASQTGWFLLGVELSRFDELSQLVQSSTASINDDDKKDKPLSPIN
jgi:hypothetical protein